MDAVIEFADVTVTRGQATLLEGIDWTVEEDERWVVLGPNGAGKTTLLQVASAQIHPTSGVAGVLDEVLGTVDVFDLRPRIGLTSAALAERIPRSERVHDVTVSASYGVVGRWRESYDDLDHERATQLLTEVVGRLAGDGWRPAGIDLTIVAHRPRLGPHLEAMRASIATTLGLELAAVSVKASTGNLDGSEGAGRSISTLALATIEARS